MILTIYDFDQTVTINHTARSPEDYLPASNTKVGLQFDHNADHFTAVATFHKDPLYVLTYLLPLLNLSAEHVMSKKTEGFADHQLLYIHFKTCNTPLIIATPLADDYDMHLHMLDSRGGKNELIRTIIAALPPCYEYHFYDDDKKNYSAAKTLNNLHCYHVDGKNPRFAILTRSKPPAHSALKNRLIAYLGAPKIEREDKPGKLSPSSNAFSLFAHDSSPKSKGKDTTMIIKKLLDFLNSTGEINEGELKILESDSDLGSLLGNWQDTYHCTLPGFIKELTETRRVVAAMETHYIDSDDDSFKSFPRY